MIKFLNMKRRFSTVAQVASQSCEWADYYSSISPKSETISSRIDLTDEMHYIKDSSFKSLSSSSQSGAAIYFSVSQQLLVEYSLFAKCVTNNANGGAIYVTSGEFVVAYTCANGCSAGTSAGQFSCQYVSSGTQSGVKQNAIIDSSVAYCNSASSKGYNAFRMVYGKINISTVNVSRNTIYASVAFVVAPTNNNLSTASNDANNADCSITYCTVSNNNAIDTNIIYMSYGSTNPTHLMAHCNIIENSQVNYGYGLIFTYSNTISNINYCCILGNKCGKLFQAWDSTTTIMNINNCTIDEITGISEKEGMRTQSSFIFGITHYAVTGYCYASFDVIGSLEPDNMPDVPEITTDQSEQYDNEISFCPPQIYKRHFINGVKGI